MLKVTAWGQERQTKREKQKWAMCAGTTILDQLTSTTTEMCPTGRCTYRTTATFFDACAWTTGNVPWCLRVEAKLRATSMSRWSTKTCFPENFLYDACVLLNTGNNYWLNVVVVPHCSYLIAPRCSCTLRYTDRKPLTAMLELIQ